MFGNSIRNGMKAQSCHKVRLILILFIYFFLLHLVSQFPFCLSQEDWVCTKDMYQTNTFALNRIGEVIGTFFFGQLGDR